MLRMQDILAAMKMAKQDGSGNTGSDLLNSFQSGQKLGKMLKNAFAGSEAAAPTAGQTVAGIGNVASSIATPLAGMGTIPPIPPVL